MKPITISLVILFLLLTLLANAARQVGQAAETPEQVAIMLPDDSCPAPCWNGLNPDHADHASTVARVMSLPNAAHSGILEWTFALDEALPQQVRLEGGRYFILWPRGVRLGDVLTVMGMGDYQLRGSVIDRRRFNANQEYLQLFYEDEQMTVTVFASLEGRLSPEMPVQMITYPVRPLERPTTAHEWQGFIQMQAYPINRFGPTLFLD